MKRIKYYGLKNKLKEDRNLYQETLNQLLCDLTYIGCKELPPIIFEYNTLIDYINYLLRWIEND